MNAFRAAHGNNSATEKVLRLTEEDISLFDPLTAAAARLMIARGRAVLIDQEAV